MNKKGQGLSLNVIIVAAIALIVLIVLWAIFTGKMGAFTEGVSADTQKCKDLCAASGKPTANADLSDTDCGAASVGKIDNKWCCCKSS